jgi:hypothetical protein
MAGASSPRATVALAGAPIAVLLGSGVADGTTYALRVRRAPSPDSGVAGYLVAVHGLAGTSPPVVAPGLPPATADGSLAAEASGLDGCTDYEVTVTASASTGEESAPAIAITIGYAQVAARIDTYGDGLTDAAEDRNLNGISIPTRPAGGYDPWAAGSPSPGGPTSDSAVPSVWDASVTDARNKARPCRRPRTVELRSTVPFLRRSSLPAPRPFAGRFQVRSIRLARTLRTDSSLWN